MTLRRLGAGVVLIAALVSAVAGQKAPDDKEFQAALQKEMVAGDLKGAIEAYRRIAGRSGVERGLAAEALLRMADCHQKLGNAEALAIYQRIVKEFGDQRDVAQRAARQLGPTAALASGRSGRTSWFPPPTVSIHGKVSPDGRWLPYVDDGPQEGFIGAFLLRDLRSGTVRRVAGFPQLPVQQAEYAEGSAFSRDGGLLAYAWRVRARGVYQLKVVSTSGSQASHRVLFDNPEVSWLAPYDWTPDGRSIAVVVQRKDRTAALGLVSSETGAFRQLQSLEWDSVSNVALSPAGDLIAFDRRQPDGARDVFALAINGSRQTTVVSSKADDSLVGWSPDGGRLLFLSDRSGSVDLWAVPVASGRSAGEARQLRSNVGRFWPAGVMRDGAIVAAVVSAGGAQLRVGGLPADSNMPNTPRVIDEFIGPSTQLSWSQDGERLAVVSQYIGMRPLTPIFMELLRPRLSVRAVDTDEGRTLPRGVQYINNFMWAPDDRTLIVAGADLVGRTGLFRIDALNGATTAIVITPDEQPTMPGRWGSLLGSRLYYQRNVIATQTARFVELDLTTGAEREILPWAPRFADGPPDPRPVRSILGVTQGRCVLYTARNRSTGETIFYVRAIESGDDRELMRASASDTVTVLDLLSDHSAVLFSRKTGAGQSEVWRARLDGSDGPTRVATVSVDLTSYRGLGAAGTDGIYLSRRSADDGPQGAFEIVRLSTDGTLNPVTSFGNGTGRVGQVTRLSPDTRRLAFVTEYQPPAAPLEVAVLENLLQPAGPERR